MTTKQQPKGQPESNQEALAKRKWEPPRGIRYSFRKDRPKKPFYLHWRDKDTGKREATGFADKKARELKAKELALMMEKHGEEVLSFDPTKWRKFLEFEKIVGAGTDPVVVAHEWRKSQQGEPKVIGKKVSEAVIEYLRLRDLEKCWSADTRRHVGKQLDRFMRKFGAVRLHEIDKDQVRDWLYALTDDDGNALGPHAINDHRKTVRMFFQYALNERWGALDNPCANIKAPRAEDKDPVVIPLRDAWEFFRANCDQRVTARVAMEAFGGIRYTTAGLLEKDAVNTETKGIRMKAAIHKSGKKDGRSRYRQGHPDNLWAWITHAPEATWKMNAHDYREEKRYAYITAKLRPAANTSAADGKKITALRNIWRHSFVSYHLAAFRNVPLTQYLAQHSNPQITEEYEGVAEHEDALRYFMISPETVKLSWKEFLALPLADEQKSEAQPKSTKSKISRRNATAG
ncbi:site-specific recombinase XerD [Ereboglobus sp. PH5-5]|uniref:hypothetical protein n=1 Tax=Ereboglobus sp. PH5-5 TaxID=2940529 RepID=UPI0024058AD9|nr:hypothetical protein [Ereboglobus sp. PH5-5]MDF9833096.1 site-specific recombinase XerD [Ereboglobus sp. PH5-5]